MQEKFLGEYLPATLTFIVGLLGILSQLSINFFSEWHKYRIEYSKTKKENIYEYYLPLLVLARQYRCYQAFLKHSDIFTLSNGNYPDLYEFQCQYKLLKDTYESIELLSKGHYIPTNRKLNKEIQKFNKHIITVNCLWKGKCQEKFFKEIIPNNELCGYNVDLLISLLESAIKRG